MLDEKKLNHIESDLSSFDYVTRRKSVDTLAALIECGKLLPQPIKSEVNLHYHTFFSFNSQGWSPERIAWEARKYGLAIAGIVDFDVLDGLDEFLHSCSMLGVRGCVSMETRVFVKEYADIVINSPNEPGITYFMAAGCCLNPDPQTSEGNALDLLRCMADTRNKQVIYRVNEYLDTVRLDYLKDVLPLAPSGNATERHMLAAYDSKARLVYPCESDLAAFWEDKLGFPHEETSAIIGNTPTFHEKMRSKLMKHGGIGYVAPTPDTFPAIDTVIEMTRSIGALPMATWLDGTNPGEQNTAAILRLLVDKGILAVTMIPERNWNIKDAKEKAIKVHNFGLAVQAARELDLPICIGTEMNKAGLPFVDNFQAPELQPYIQDFLDGAYFLWGHTFLARNLNAGYLSEWATANLPQSRSEKNAFYTRVGMLADPKNGIEALTKLCKLNITPQEIITALQQK